MTDFSATLDAETARYCRDDVAAPWEQALRINRGEETTGWMRPFMGIGPAVPVAIAPYLTPPAAVRAALGRRANLATVVFNRTRNRIVFLAVERADNGLYLEMRRLDGSLPAASVDRVSRSVQAGAEADAIAFLGDEMRRIGSGEFAPDVIKVADLNFFDAFAALAALQRAGKKRAWLRASAKVAHKVLRERLVYFYPAVPFEKVLAIGRRIV